MRYKISISAPALLSAAVFVLGLFVLLFYSFDEIEGISGSGFVISITLQALIIYLVSLALVSFLLFALLKRRE